jgi:hypothetical protein
VTISYTEIIRLAALSCKPNPSLTEQRELDFGLFEIGDAASRLVIMARKLMKGKPFRVMCNDPELLREYRALGKALGAQINVVEQDDWPTELHFTPRLSQ